MTSEMKSSAIPASDAPGRLGAGNWTILVVLLLLLGLTIFVAYLGWTFAGAAEVPESGYVAMVLGVVLSLVVGVGLMALVFYSSRKGYDEPPALVANGERDVISPSSKSEHGLGS